MAYSEFLQGAIGFCNSDRFKELDENYQRLVFKKTQELECKEYKENKKRKAAAC